MSVFKVGDWVCSIHEDDLDDNVSPMFVHGLRRNQTMVDVYCVDDSCDKGFRYDSYQAKDLKLMQSAIPLEFVDFDTLIDLALMTNDKVWFDRLIRSLNEKVEVGG